MLKCIHKMKGFGIFDDYAKPAKIEDFSDRNIIYGWNYSGKTTISRLFGMMQWKKIHDDFPSAEFQVTDHGDASITHETIAACSKTVRVFNSDFIQNSLKWDGTSFNPILLLGDEPIEAHKKIGIYEKLIKRCARSAALKRATITDIDSIVAEGKTTVAKQIKTTLGIVDAFTATHLTSVLALVGVGGAKYTLNAEQLASDLKLAVTAEKDKSAVVAKLTTTLVAKTLHGQATTLLFKTPEFSQTIEYLKEHPEVSDWVEQGLHLHEEKTNCEFCGSPVTVTRLAELRTHFSQDVVNHKERLRATIEQVTAAKLESVDRRASEFNAQFRDRLVPILSRVGAAIAAYNGWLVGLTDLLNTKLKSQFVPVAAPSDPATLVDELTAAVLGLNALIEENNQISENFASEKSNAIERLKKHFAEQFLIDYKIEESEQRKRVQNFHAERYENAAKTAEQKVGALQATINRAQQGREKINTRISNLLGSDSIQIKVIKVGEDDRFQITRQGKAAKNLSEGEKTAIAFAFFLTKLQEITMLRDVIVYIDDPISSLDSNHIFQVFSIVKNTFFYKDDKGNGQHEWKTTCKQLFISTHNFEFFSLLRDLPGWEKKMRYYLTKRVSATDAVFTDLPRSILKYSSEYHYLFSLIYGYQQSADKQNIELLLSLPNAVRRFVELYTYSKIPLPFKTTVDQRAERLFGAEKSQRLLKVLHHFSHLNSIERLATNTDLVSDIEVAISEIVEHIKTADPMHYEALVQSVV